MRAIRLGLNGLEMLKPTIRTRLTEGFDTNPYDQRQHEDEAPRKKRKKPGSHTPATPWELPRQDGFTARAEPTPSPQVQAPQPRLPGR